MWCGVVWCGVVWYGSVWCGVVCRGVVWRGVAWCGVAWCGVAWRGVVWRGVAWRGVVWCGVGVVLVGCWCGFRSRTRLDGQRYGSFLRFHAVTSLPKRHVPRTSVSSSSDKEDRLLEEKESAFTPQERVTSNACHVRAAAVRLLNTDC